jgi:histidinol dehydrogenase
MNRRAENILRDVKAQGDTAVRRYSLRFDGFVPRRIPESEVTRAFRQVSPNHLQALKAMARSVERFARIQKSSLKEFTYRDISVTLSQRLTPIERVGCYVPGGRFPLASTAIMTIVPARVAGVKEIVVCTPRPAPEILAAVAIGGGDVVFQLGGAQAIAAMAYGTKTVPKVDMIVGPGNQWVVEAKRGVFGDVGIDLLAGPSEIAVIADDSADPELVASELLAQAEHGADSRVWLATTSKRLGSLVKRIVGNCASIRCVRNMTAAVGLVNKLAPEHLALHTRQPEKLLKQLKHFGTVFLGERTSVVFGDYGLGPNHTLPTGGAARFRGGLSVLDFLRLQTIQKVCANGVTRYSRMAQTLALSEGLDSHANAAKLRLTR